MEKIAVIAGEGKLPFLLIGKIKERGQLPVILALEGIADKRITQQAHPVYWLQIGELKKMLSTLKKEVVGKLIFSGRVDKRLVFESPGVDGRIERLLRQMEDKGDRSLLRTLAGIFEREGIKLVSPYEYLSSYIVNPGVLSKREPSSQEMADIRFGWNIAKNIANLDIGNTVVVKEGIILAVECVEGTDSTIIRGGKLGGRGSVVVKVARDNQQSRFDHPPVIGLTTCKVCSSVGIFTIGFEAGKTILLEKEVLLQECNSRNIALVGL